MKPNEEIRIFEHTHIMDGLKPVIYTENKPPYVSLYIPVDHNNRAGGRSDWDRIEYKDLKSKQFLTLSAIINLKIIMASSSALIFLKNIPIGLFGKMQ